MKKQSYYLVVAEIFSVLAVLHVLRLVYGWEAVIGGVQIPLWVSWLVVPIAGVLAYFGFKLRSEK